MPDATMSLYDEFGGATPVEAALAVSCEKVMASAQAAGTMC